MPTFLSYDTIQTLGESGERAFRGNTTMQSSNTRRKWLAASRDENRAMWRTTYVLPVKNRLGDYRMFQANYGTAIQY